MKFSKSISSHKKVRPHTALYHIFSFNILHLLILPFPVYNGMEWIIHLCYKITVLSCPKCLIIIILRKHHNKDYNYNYKISHRKSNFGILTNAYIFQSVLPHCKISAKWHTYSKLLMTFAPLNTILWIQGIITQWFICYKLMLN